ncbi:hypothetical protein ROSINTL182_09546 [Roseburia intestinalis L1-82]|uniref:Uncharacterized protein n=1 Tax=Roseburia intestinalis L1-82 TaxID=536231 RepID=C7GHX5_9FIRM|nr:hypothetical protein ROSINTL182_09546 [Roseburia intestinalis L1-82]
MFSKLFLNSLLSFLSYAGFCVNLVVYYMGYKIREIFFKFTIIMRRKTLCL